MDNEFCTARELLTKYGISKVKTSKAIKNGQLSAFMKNGIDADGNEYTIIKWYIERNKSLDDFIQKERKF